jgi:hypothetical protein
MLVDWWASRSIRATERQIAKLERQLKRPQLFDDVVFRLFRSVLAAVIAIAIGLVNLVASLDQTVEWIHKTLQFVSMFCFFVAACNAQWGQLLASVAQAQEAREYDQEFKNRIEHLRLRLPPGS